MTRLPASSTINFASLDHYPSLCTHILRRRIIRGATLTFTQATEHLRYLSGTSSDLNQNFPSSPDLVAMCKIGAAVPQRNPQHLDPPAWRFCLSRTSPLVFYAVITGLNLNIKFYSLAIRFHLLDFDCFHLTCCKKDLTQ